MREERKYGTLGREDKARVRNARLARDSEGLPER